MTLFIILCFLIFIIIIRMIDRKPSGIPPGKWGLPVVGYLPVGTGPLKDKTISKMKKKFGDLFTWRVGSRLFIIGCSPEHIRMAFSKSEIAARPDFFTYKCIRDFKEKGIILSSGDKWLNNRNFSIKTLKNLGMGKSSMESVVQFEAKALVDNLAKNLGPQTGLPMSLNVAVLNVIWKLVANRRYDVGDAGIMHFEYLMTQVTQQMQKPSVIVFDMFPWLLKVAPWFLQTYLGVNDNLDKLALIKAFLKSNIEEHEKTFDPQNPLDLIDFGLLEIKEGSNGANFDYDDLLQLLFDFFAAGSESTAATIRWAVNYLSKYKLVQEKVQKEIDDIIGRNRQPCMEDKKLMPYTEAVIHESLRLSSFLPFAFPHQVMENTELGGYAIPKGSIFLGYTEGCHKNPDYWDMPNEFYPEHFLDQEGKFTPRKEFLPFSVGNRLCVGDNLAKMEIFIFLTTVFQKLSFSPVSEKKFDTEKNSQAVFFNVPKNFNILISERDSPK